MLLRGPEPNGVVVILTYLLPSHFGNVIKQGLVIARATRLRAARADALVMSRPFSSEMRIERNAGCFDRWNLDKWHWPLLWKA